MFCSAWIVAGLLLLPSLALGQATRTEGWSGNFAKNPGFEEDFVNEHGEGHVLSFKGDWFYNQKDLVPDYWQLAGPWTWSTDKPKTGGHYLKLAAGGAASQTFPGLAYQDGGSAWAGAGIVPIKVADPAKLSAPWRASVWVRGGGAITLGGVTAKAPAAADWQLLTVELPVDKVKIDQPMNVTLTGPGDFDDLVVQEKLPASPNLIPNSGFEQAKPDGSPIGFSTQKKYRAIGPTYYVWTDWNHTFRDTRGPVTVDKLVSYAGQQSLRFDVYPGDEKYIESDAIALNQTQPGVVEVGVYVRADRIKLFDIRCVDENGANLRGYYPIQPENLSGGSSTYGNGTFEWRYVRKFFTSAFDQPGKPGVAAPIKSIRLRLCARGFNGHTLDDSGTRSYACQTGTVWWDNLYVTERGSDAAALAARGVKTYPVESIAPGPLADVQLDLGQRLYGTNHLSYSFTNGGAAGSYSLKLTTTLPGEKSVVTKSAPASVVAKGTGRLEAPYEIKQLAGDLMRQGQFQLELERDGKPVASSVYAFNTWPVVVDFDVARSYSLPQENPVTVSLNLGVADGTLAKVKTLEIGLARANDPGRIVHKVSTITDLKAAFAQTIAGLPRRPAESYEFKLPTPAWWTDRTNLLLLKVDLSPLKVWPHDQPTRDTVLVARGLDAAGKELFRDQSDPFGRMAAPPQQPPIQSVEVRSDGAVLINGQPRFLTGASHQNLRIGHSPEIMALLGLNGMRLIDSAKFPTLAQIWSEYHLYIHQAKALSGQASTASTVEMTDAQKQELAAFAASGGMQNVVAINTGGWEGHIPDDAASRAKHQATNDYVRQVTKRPVCWSQSGGFNAWNTPVFPYYDINFGETEMWGPMDYNVIWTPYMKRLYKRPSTWVYLPQLYDNTPYERFRFEMYENAIRGSAGFGMIQGIGDPTFNRGLAGELRYLEQPFYSQETPAAVTFEPNVSHKVTRYKGKTYIVATNAGPIQIGNWKWNSSTKQSGERSHEGDTVNTMWFRPAGIRIHGFRGLPMPELIQRGDKIVQYVWLDPKETPDWAMVAVRGDGKFIHNAVLGNFDFAKFKNDLGNILMFSELNHSVWHEINWVFDKPTYDLAVKLIGQAEADRYQKEWVKYHAAIDALAYQAEHFKNLGPKPGPGKWHRIEMDAERFGLVGKLVDGFAYLTQNGRALWDYSALERNGKVVRVFCEDTVGIDRKLLDKVRINVPGLAKGTKVRAVFEDREITADAGGFNDNFQGTDTYQYEAGGVEGDLLGYVKDPNRELPRMMPSGQGYKYGPTAVRIYEIQH